MRDEKALACSRVVGGGFPLEAEEALKVGNALKLEADNRMVAGVNTMIELQCELVVQLVGVVVEIELNRNTTSCHNTTHCSIIKKHTRNKQRKRNMG